MIILTKEAEEEIRKYFASTGKEMVPLRLFQQAG